MSDLDRPGSLAALAAEVGQWLVRAGSRLATAESCTGGLIAATCTDVAGSSEWFEAGFVTYRLSAKQRVLGIRREDLDRYDAVSEPVAKAMATAALERSDADVSVSVTGIAGPGGGAVDHPVGTVWFAWAARGSSGPELIQASIHQLPGTRAEVRARAVQIALNGVLDALTR